MYTFDERLERVLSRRNPWPTTQFSGRIALANARVFDSAEFTSAVERMVYLAMQPVDESCVEKSKEAGERVKEHLKNKFNALEMPVPKFEYQGSVVANTQIKGASDIDLLVINEQSFYWDEFGVKKEWESVQRLTPIPTEEYKLKTVIDLPTYNGSGLDDVKQQRKVCEECLTAIYDDCNTRKGKSIQILNKSLDQKVDVVNCIWFDDARSIKHDDQYPYRGIKILDKVAGALMMPDYPFIKIALIDGRDGRTNGHYKELIRLVKTLKEDVGGCEVLSSFDIYSILYAMPESSYALLDGNDLVFALKKYLQVIAENRQVADAIKKLDCQEVVFKDDDAKFQAFRKVYEDLVAVCESLKNTQHRVLTFG